MMLKLKIRVIRVVSGIIIRVIRVVRGKNFKKPGGKL